MDAVNMGLTLHWDGDIHLNELISEVLVNGLGSMLPDDSLTAHGDWMQPYLMSRPAYLETL